MEASAARGAHCDFLASMSSLEISPKRGTASGVCREIDRPIDRSVKALPAYDAVAFQSISGDGGRCHLKSAIADNVNYVERHLIEECRLCLRVTRR
jgi:hypothetical protein